MDIPDTLRYTQNHEWVKIEGNVATVGITDYAQGELGDVVYIDVTTVGQEVQQNDVLGTIEAVKTVSDLFAPLTGKVVMANPTIDGSPESINNDPYEAGWIAKIEVTDPSESKLLLSAEDYLKQIGK